MLSIDGPLVGVEVAVGANLILDVMVEVISALLWRVDTPPQAV